MCLIVVAFRQHPRFPLILAANRDEYFRRPTAAAEFWESDEQILAGRDLKAGGTWLGVARDGRFAAVTNFRDTATPNPAAPSRGRLVSEFLQSGLNPREYMDNLAQHLDEFNGFNLLVGTIAELCVVSNRAPAVHKLNPGIYGLSNHLLDTPWPKVSAAKADMKDLLVAEDQQIDAERIFELLAQQQRFPASDLPDTGVGPAIESMLSPIFIRGDDYDTRCSTVWIVDREGRSRFSERSFDARARTIDTREFEFELAWMAA